MVENNLEETTIRMLNKIVEILISSDLVEACHRIGGRKGETGTIIRFVNRKRCKKLKPTEYTKTMLIYI